MAIPFPRASGPSREQGRSCGVFSDLVLEITRRCVSVSPAVAQVSPLMRGREGGDAGWEVPGERTRLRLLSPEPAVSLPL